MKVIFMKSIKAAAWFMLGLILLIFALLFLFQIIFFAGVWYKETFM